MRVAVTGASGFIGSHVANALVKNGHEVFGFGRRSRESCHLFDRRVLYQQWDFVLEPFRPMPTFNAVVHCGAAVDDWGKADEIRATNVTGTEHVISAFPGARFIYMSSSSVYRALVDHVAVAETAALPRHYLNAYAATKRDAERMVLERVAGSVILRPHAVYGPGDTTLLPRILAARRAGVILVPGNGRNHISLTHVSTLSAVVVKCLDPAVPGGIYNVCDAETPTVNEAIIALFGALSMDVKLVYIPRSFALGLATGLELIWRLVRRPKPPRITRYAVAHVAYEYTLDRTKLNQIMSGDGIYWMIGIREAVMGGPSNQRSGVE